MTRTHSKTEVLNKYDPSKLEDYLEINPDTKNSVLYSLCGATTDSQKGYIRKAKSRFLNNSESSLESPESKQYKVSTKKKAKDIFHELDFEEEFLEAEIDQFIKKYNEMRIELINAYYFICSLKRYLGNEWGELESNVVNSVIDNTGDVDYKSPFQD